jgi:hypothetical protein
LSIIYIVGVGILIGFLLITFFDHFNRPKFLFEHDLPTEVKRSFTKLWQPKHSRLANRICSAGVYRFGFQVYWTVLCRRRERAVSSPGVQRSSRPSRFGGEPSRVDV